MESFIVIYDLTAIGMNVIIAPVCVGLLYFYLGLAGLAGALISFITFFTIIYFSRLFKLYWKDSTIHSDKRATLVNDII